MKKEEIKNFLKPIIEECVREILLKEVIENVVSQTLKEQKTTPKKKPIAIPDDEDEVVEQRPLTHPTQRLLEGKYGKMFQGLSPMRDGPRKPTGIPADVAGAEKVLNAPIGNLDPEDPGVSLNSGIFKNLFKK